MINSGIDKGKFKQGLQYPFKAERIGSYLLDKDLNFFTSNSNRVYPVKTIYKKQNKGEK